MKRTSERNRKNRIWNRYLKSRAGMTLTEMLAAVLILSMTAVAVGGGVVVVKDAYKKTTEKAEAQQVLATTVELMTDFLSDASQVKTGNTAGPAFLSTETGTWMRLVSEPYKGKSDESETGTDSQETEQAVGICKAYNVGEDGTGTGIKIPLLTEEAMGGIFYTDFGPDTAGDDKYQYSDGYFIVKNINVYYKTDAANPKPVPMAHLDQLMVRAVNLEE